MEVGSARHIEDIVGLSSRRAEAAASIETFQPMTRLGPGQECSVCGGMLVIPPLARGFVRDEAEYVCRVCGRCYAWTSAKPPALVCIDPAERRDIPTPPLAK